MVRKCWGYSQLRWPSGKASGSGAVHSSFIPSRDEPMTLKLVFTACLLDTRHYRDSEVNKPASLLVVPLGKTMSRIPPLGVVDRWPATPKRARYCTLIAFL